LAGNSKIKNKPY